MVNWYLQLVEFQRRQDEVVQAARHAHEQHILRQPGTAKKRGQVLAALLTKVGTYLVDWGCRLESHYQSANLVSSERTVQSAC